MQKNTQQKESIATEPVTDFENGSSDWNCIAVEGGQVEM
jgi:hypothetical protein